MLQFVVVFIGGGLGSILRFTLAGLIQTASDSFFPWGTFVVNATGCLVIGYCATVLQERSALSATWRTFMLYGVLGGYTTFSSFGLETWRLIEGGDWLRAAANAVASVIVGLVAVAAGVAIGRVTS